MFLMIECRAKVPVHAGIAYTDFRVRLLGWELHSFIRHSLSNSKALPLTELTKKKQPEVLVWSDQCQQAFESIRQSLEEGAFLQLPNTQFPFVLRTDASGGGLGATLMQDQGEGLLPVAFASRKLSGAELRYHTIEIECLAVVWGVRRFYAYLYGREFTLQADHHPLQFLDRIRPVSRRLMGWAAELQAVSFNFRYIPGSQNVEADYLSRMTHLDEE